MLADSLLVDSITFAAVEMESSSVVTDPVKRCEPVVVGALDSYCCVPYCLQAHGSFLANWQTIVVALPATSQSSSFQGITVEVHSKELPAKGADDSACSSLVIETRQQRMLDLLVQQHWHCQLRFVAEENK